MTDGDTNTDDNTSASCLMIVTSTYHDDPSCVHTDLERLWTQTIPPKHTNSRKKVLFFSGLPTHNLIQLYKIVDTFVLLSCGEGWGRPYIEAMTMGFPIIATNWSGSTKFVTQENRYLLPLLPSNPLIGAHLKAFSGHIWANLDVNKLVDTLRHL